MVAMTRRKKQTIKDIKEYLNQIESNLGFGHRGSIEYDEYLVGPKYALQ